VRIRPEGTVKEEVMSGGKKERIKEREKFVVLCI
jgi:hypothetical protein